MVIQYFCTRITSGALDPICIRHLEVMVCPWFGKDGLDREYPASELCRLAVLVPYIPWLLTCGS